MMSITDTLRSYVGHIDDKEKENVCNEISTGSRPSNEYFIMLAIAATIATIGLLTDSVAVIIGAMLVSPLLIPVIGISLGAVKGDFELFSRAFEAELKGIALALIIVIILTLLIPNAAITTEILLRTHPTPLDLLVALASGAAAAYALSKKNISAALPGVAIAVAVLPPLSVVGIGFALKRFDVSVGAFLTFLANIVAINFAASAVFWLMNFSPKWSLTAEKETMQKLKTSAVLLLIILIPLAWIMWDSVSISNTQATINSVLTAQLDGIVEARLADFDFENREGGGLAVSATIISPKEITSVKAEEMRLALEKNLKASVDLNLIVTKVELLHTAHSS